MGFSLPLTGFPLFVLLISILVGSGGAITGSGQAVGFNGQTPNGAIATYDCSGHVNTACFNSLPTSATITCNSGSICTLVNFCAPNVAPPMYCLLGSATVMNTGEIATIIGGTVTNGGNAFFKFANIGIAGFVLMISLAIGVAALVGINIVGTGENSETVHVLFMGGIMLGFWFFLSAIEGFLTNSSTSFFTQLNGALSGFGTTTYVFLTLIYSLSIVKAISRGGT